jgi:hypothetical protein
MIIYKTINKINGKWYIGKDMANNPNYYGSGKLITQAITKYGKDNFEKIILETCTSKDELSLREKFWISQTKATSDPLSYNLASGGEGGDLSKFIDYSLRRPGDKFAGRNKWFKNLTDVQKKDILVKQANSRAKGWYVSKVDDPTEVYVHNISKWCEDNGVDKSMPTTLNNPSSRLFQKQTKGWRIRRANMPVLPSYENKRGKIVVDNGCTGKSWKVVNGKRVWCNK